MKFSPFNERYIASSGDSLILWDLETNSGMNNEERKAGDLSEESDEDIILNHIGHIGTVSDFDWNPISPWTIISASDDSETFVQIQKNNDNSLQIFRPLDLLTQPTEEALQSLANAKVE